MRVLNPNYLWTCDPYTADHNYMLSKTFKMCDPEMDDGKLDTLFCGTICTSPPGSPLSQTSGVSGNESQDLFCTGDIDLKGILEDCNPAARALAEVQATLQLEYTQPGTELSLPICTLGGIDVLPSDSRTGVPSRLAQNSTSLDAKNMPHLLDSKEQLLSSFVLTNDDKSNEREHVLQFGFTSPLPNGPTKNQTQAEASQTPIVDPVPVIHRERLASRTSVTVIPFLAENKGKRKRSSNEVTEPTAKKRRVAKKGTKPSPGVADAAHPSQVEQQQPSSSTVPSNNSQNLPVQRRRRARMSTKEKPEVIDVDQEPLPSHASPSTVIPQPNGLRQLLPASMRPVPAPRVQSISPLSPGNGFAMPPAHTSFPSPVAQPPALSSQATSLPFNTVFPNNLGYGVGHAENLGMPPATFDQVSNYSAQYLERQRALLLRQQMQAHFQQGRGMNQTIGTSFFDPLLVPNGTTMPQMLAPTTMNNSNWSHHGSRGAGPFLQNSSLHSQVMDPFDTFGATWTPPVQATTRTHHQNWYP